MCLSTAVGENSWIAASTHPLESKRSATMILG